MAVLSREELLDTIKKYTENAEGDEVLTDVENIVETINAYNSKADVEERIKEVNEEWHKKFIDKFFSSNTEVEEVEEEKEDEEKEDEEIFIEIEKED